MSQVDTLIDEIEAKAARLSGATHGAAADMVQLLCDFDSALAQLRAQCRELSMMNQLLRERLARSLEQMRELSNGNSSLGCPHLDSHPFEKLDPR